ncbi:CerR family C-terminal domain-containing protein [Novosphingobium sp. KCTC 2891]|uniref:CerR family C-terminal domain-containing protein n=1 Tax=Novosphingobium sp. KCTC 2891 TaxID=2989730 RepID=UPI0022231F44|nr:CerR family C-terminal domain-containing protein [Novosphingobium sp. KCTC 2891]MCW1382142.1 CerR family C-terminal domain-containing protein [Novosphingobium sp. KCTC 2891]
MTEARPVRRGGYRKGEESRQRILEVAIREFGRVGFTAATTRTIAQQAGATLPSLQYYFGGKEGLYRACAEEIAARFIAMTVDAAQGAAEALVAGAGDLRAELKRTMAAVARAMTGSDAAGLWGAFVSRELLAPGPAFDVMLEKLFAPGIDLIAAMIARVQGREEADEPARIRAMLMIASLTAFQSGRSVALRVFGWDDVGAAQLAAITAALDAEIDAL